VNSKQLQPVGLSYVNVSLDHRPDGTISAEAFFTRRARDVWWQQASVSHMIAGGVRLVVLSHGLNDDELLPGAAGVEYVLRCFDSVVCAAEASDRCVLVRSKSDLDEARRAAKLAVVLHLTGCPVNGSIQMLDVLARLGVRSCHPMLHDTTIGGYWNAPPDSQGLTRYGKQLIREMEARHILVDTAHAGDRTFRDVLRAARRPVLDSHTGCRAILDSKRNRTDDQMKAIAATGGVVGVHFGSALLALVGNHPLRPRLVAQRNRQIARYHTRQPDPYKMLSFMYDPQRWSSAIGGAKRDGLEPPRASLEQLCNHIEHMVNVTGIDHVCIGSDYALGGICAGVETAAKLQNLALALTARGFRRADLNKILVANLERLLRMSLPA